MLGPWLCLLVSCRLLVNLRLPPCLAPGLSKESPPQGPGTRVLSDQTLCLVNPPRVPPAKATVLLVPSSGRIETHRQDSGNKRMNLALVKVVETQPDFYATERMAG